MTVAWVILAPTNAHVARHKWLASLCSSSGNAWLTFHQWGGYGVGLMAGVAWLIAILDFDLFSGNQAHRVRPRLLLLRGNCLRLPHQE